MSKSPTMKSEFESIKSNHQLSPWETWCFYMIRIGNYFKSFPLTFNTYEAALYLTKSKYNLYIWYIRLVVLTLDNIYLLLISKKIRLGSTPEKEFLNFWAHTVTRIAACVIMWAVALDWQGAVQIFNIMTRNRRSWMLKFGKWGTDFTGPLEKQLRQSVQFTTVFVSIQPLFPLGLHFENRESARYWGSQILSRNIYDSYLGIFCFAAYDFSLSALVIQNCCYVVFITLAYFALMTFWATEMKKNMQKIKLLACSSPLKQYRCLLTLSRIANNCIEITILPTLIFMASFLLSIFWTVLIRVGFRLSVPMLANLIIASGLFVRALKIVLDGGGQILRTSQHVKFLFKLEKDLYRRKYIGSLRDIRVYLGQFSYVSQGAFVAVISWVLDQTITFVFALDY